MSLTPRVLASMENIQRLVNCKIHPHVDGGWFIRFPGFKYDDFNRAGVLSLARMDRVNQLITAKLSSTDKVLYFALGRHWTFSPSFYRRAAVDFPMTMRSVVSGVGSSSFDQHQTFFFDDRHTEVSSPKSDAVAAARPLASCVYRLVYADPVTRRPTRLPADVAKTLSEAIVAGAESFPMFRAPASIPDDIDRRTFGCQTRVRYNDMDFYLHTNISSYIEFALECAAQAAESGFYSAISGDVAFYRVKKATSLYLGESQAGDELTVSTWEDADNQMLLNFAVRKQENVIYYSQIEYFDNNVVDEPDSDNYI